MVPFILDVIGVFAVVTYLIISIVEATKEVDDLSYMEEE